MSKDRLDDIRERNNKRTQGPWNYDGMHNEITCNKPEFWLILSELREHPNEEILDGCGHTYNPNFDFIAHAPEDITYLLAEVERMKKENAKLLRHIFCIYGAATNPHREED